MKSILHPYEIWTTNYQVHSLVVVGLLHHLSMLAWEHQMWEYHLNSNDLFSFGCCLLSRSIILVASTKHLKCPLDHHFHVNLSSTTLGLPTKGGKPLHIGRSDLSSRTILDTHLKWLDWLIQVMDLIWWVTMNPSLSSFYFYLFKYFSFSQMISICHWT